MEHGSYKSYHEAVAAGDLELVRGFVRAGVDVNFTHPEFQSTALATAILNGHEKVALFLLDEGTDPNQLSPIDEVTPFQAAEQVGLGKVSLRISQA